MRMGILGMKRTHTFGPTGAVILVHVAEIGNGREKSGSGMATLIRVSSSDGCNRCCNAMCYNAKTPICKCICQGANHGVGLTRALDNCRLMAEEWLEQYGRDHPGASGQLTLPPEGG